MSLRKRFFLILSPNNQQVQCSFSCVFLFFPFFWTAYLKEKKIIKINKKLSIFVPVWWARPYMYVPPPLKSCRSRNWSRSAEMHPSFPNTIKSFLSYFLTPNQTTFTHAALTIKEGISLRVLFFYIWWKPIKSYIFVFLSLT